MSLYVCGPDEEEDEEITAPPPAEDNQEEKDEQGEQQEEGKDKNLQYANIQSVRWLLWSNMI